MNPEERIRLTFILRVLLITCGVTMILLLLSAWNFRIECDTLYSRIKAIETQLAAKP